METVSSEMAITFCRILFMNENAIEFPVEFSVRNGENLEIKFFGRLVCFIIRGHIRQN